MVSSPEGRSGPTLDRARIVPGEEGQLLLFLAQPLSEVIGSPDRPHGAVVRGVGREAPVPSLGPCISSSIQQLFKGYFYSFLGVR